MSSSYYPNKDYEVEVQRRFDRILRLTKYALREQVFDLDRLGEKALESFDCTPTSLIFDKHYARQKVLVPALQAAQSPTRDAWR